MNKNISKNKTVWNTWRKIILISICLCICTFSLFAQNKITGKVTGVDGVVVGANVWEKGTSNGVMTDQDGNFSVTVPENAVLQISFIGYISQEIAVRNRTSLDITLVEDTQALEEVVVVGYGTQKKVNLTGAVAQVKGEVLENRSVTNISQALQGQVANLNIAQTSSGGTPGATQSFNIRGYTGFGSTSAPLVVIDGIQGGDINNVSMSDVENISVLKDAASAAIYGSSAPYGVILITTKKGKPGQKPTITYNNNFGFVQPISLPKTMNSLETAEYYNEAAANANMAPIYNDVDIQLIKDYLAGTITTEIAPDPTPGVDNWLRGNANNDWYDIFFKDISFNQQHNVGVSGSLNRSSYYVGLGYIQQEGILNYGNNMYQKYNARVNLSSDLTNWLTFSLRGAFSRGTSDNPNEYDSTYGNMMNIISWQEPTFPHWFPVQGEDVIDYYTGAYRDGGRIKRASDNTILTGEFVFHPLAGWDITANYAFDGVYVNSSTHNKTCFVPRPSGAASPYAGNPNGFSRSSSHNQHHTINAFSSYEKQLEGHYFKVLAGYTQELYDNLSLSGGNSYLYSDNLPSISLAYGASPNVGDNASQLAIRGGFGRINYNYQEKYLLEFDGRYDGTSRFLKDVRYHFYPGISAGWVPSKESFWNPIASIVNSMKIRVEYGQLGDHGFTGYYPFYPSLNTVSPTSSNYLFSGGRESYISNPGLINSTLTWITTTTLNFGTDLSFLSNRLNISFDWYRRYMDDFVGPSEQYPAILGTSAPQSNSTAVETKGFELTIGWQHRKGDFHYGVNAVLSDYRGTVVKYPNPQRLNNTWYEGQSMGEIWGYETYGLFRSAEDVASAPSQDQIYSRWSAGDVRYVDQNNDGAINWGENTVDNPGDRKVIGNTTPRYSFGLSLNAEYKGFDFTMFLQGVGKRNIWVGTDSWAGPNYVFGVTGWIPGCSGFIQQRDRWSESAPDAYYPKYYMSDEMNKNMQTQSRYLQNAAYMRLKNLQLGYSLPTSLLGKFNCQKLRLFINVENLATFTNMIKTVDPELTYGSLDGKIYPLQRIWACGLNVTF